MPEGFEFPHSIGIWTPLGLQFGGSEQGRDARTHQAFGRLADGVSLSQAQADLDVVAARLATEYPDTNAGIRPTAVPFTEPLRCRLGETAPGRTAGGAVIFVLLIACANVANLLLSRSARRAREMSLRLSLGATRWRLVRQLLVETLLLTGLAGLAGGASSGLAVRLVTMHLGTAPYWIDYTMGRARAGARRRHLSGNGPRVRSRAGPASVEDERERPAEGRRPGRQPGGRRRHAPLDDRPVDC